MKQLFVLGLFAVTVTACSATATPTGVTGPAIPSHSKAPSSPQATPTPSPTPSPAPTLEGERQTYTTKSFVVSFILPAGWSRETEEENIIGLTGPNGTIDIETVDAAIDPTNPTGREPANIGPTVDDFVTWLREHPHLESTVPLPVTAAGHSGQQLDLALKFVGTYEPRRMCGSARCLAVVRVTETPTQADHILLVEGQRDRFIVLDVDGLRMQLDVYPKQVEDFEPFMNEAQPVIEALAIDRVP